MKNFVPGLTKNGDWLNENLSRGTLDLSNVYCKDVNKQQFNQSHYDARFWYRGLALSTESLQALYFLPGACSLTKGKENTFKSLEMHLHSDSDI